MSRKKELTVSEFARMGGYAVAKKRTQAERSEAARKAVVARWAKAKARKARTVAALLIVALGLACAACESPTAPSREKVQPVPLVQRQP